LFFRNYATVFLIKILKLFLPLFTKTNIYLEKLKGLETNNVKTQITDQEYLNIYFEIYFKKLRAIILKHGENERQSDNIKRNEPFNI